MNIMEPADLAAPIENLNRKIFADIISLFAIPSGGFKY